MSACGTLNSSESTKGSASNPFSATKGITFRLKNSIFKSVQDGGGPFDLTGFTGRAQMRQDPEGVGTPVADFIVNVLAPATSGCAEVILLPSVSTPIAPGLYVFDVEYVDGLDAENIISGTNGIAQHIQIVPGVTKP